MSPTATTRGPPRLRWSWDFGPLLGDIDTSRLLQLLTALAEGGALGAAASAAGMSYRTAWGLLRDCEQALGTSLVLMERGRGTRLTEFGAALVELDARARSALDEVHAPWQRKLEALLTPVVRMAPERLRLAASHDLALADWVEHGRRIRFELFWRGSEEALAELGRNECEMAGFHVSEDWPVTRLENWLGIWLDAARHVCLPVMRRSQGLIVARGNPHRVQSLADVSRRGLRMVNRQRGSGTRTMIDQLLAANGLRPESIAGYHHEEFTHEAIAATIAAGQADVGVGIEAAAARYDLGFVPQMVERYGFAMTRAIAESPEGKAFLARLQGNTFRQRLLAMPGYEPLPMREPGVWGGFLA
ncbi:MAG: helix-turn-helix transcriptional regulator [Rhodocyclales bacterium]|nr:helix-turn-helix transcriptional regulator [Rhodocyclales bacterium]